jgi:hypothetical protein
MRGFICIILLVLSVTSFFTSGLFFLNSEFVSLDGRGIDNRQSVEMIAELDKLPLIDIDAYEIEFCISGNITDVKDKEFSFVSVLNEQENFLSDLNMSAIDTEKIVLVCYNYLPEDGKKATHIKNLNRR